MVIHDGNLRWPRVRPAENDAPLVVNANGVETGESAFEGFQAVAGRDRKIVKHTSSVHLNLFPQRDTGNSGEAPVRLGEEQLFSIAI